MDKLKIDENSEEMIEETIEEDSISVILRLQYLLVMLLSAIGSIAILALMISPRLQVMDRDIVDMNITVPYRFELLQNLNGCWSYAVLIYSISSLSIAPVLAWMCSARVRLRRFTAAYFLALATPIVTLHLTMSLGFTVFVLYRDAGCQAEHFAW